MIFRSKFSKYYLLREGTPVEIYRIFNEYRNCCAKFRKNYWRGRGYFDLVTEFDFSIMLDYQKTLLLTFKKYELKIGKRHFLCYPFTEDEIHHKSCNVVFLKSKNSGDFEFVLREGRTYPPKGYIYSNLKKLFRRYFRGKDLSDNKYYDILSGKFNGLDNEETVFIPEPFFIATIKRISAQYPELDILPEIQIIDVIGSKKHLHIYYIRRYLKKEAQIEHLEELFAKALYMNLVLSMDVASLENSQIFIENNQPVITDPDFILFTNSIGVSDKEKQILSSYAYMKRVSKKIKHLRKKFGDGYALFEENLRKCCKNIEKALKKASTTLVD